MLVTPIGLNNLGFGSRNSVQNSSAQIKMKEALNADTVSFGNAELKAKETALNVVKDIFISLNAAKITNFNDKEAEPFTNAAKTAIDKLSENFASIAKAQWPNRSIPVAELEDGSKINAYKTFCGYFFDHEPKQGSLGLDLSNSIAIDLDEKTTVISSYSREGKQRIIKNAKGELGDQPVLKSIEVKKTPSS